MIEDRDVVLEVVEAVGKWDVMLAGIKGDEVLVVSKRECPKEFKVRDRKVSIIRYEPDEYLRLVSENEAVFREYRIIYFVKVYMRKILDLLASLEVYRLSRDFAAPE